MVQRRHVHPESFTIRHVRRKAAVLPVDGHLWLEEVSEAETDIATLVLAFLTCQLNISLITQSVDIPVEGLHEKRMPLEVMLMWLSALAIFSTIVVATCCCSSRFYYLRNYLAFWLAWAVERAGEWTMNLVWEDIWMARMCSAYLMSILSVACILLMMNFVEASDETQLRDQMLAKLSLDEQEAYVSALDRHTRNARATPTRDVACLAAMDVGLDPELMREISQALSLMVSV